MKTDENFYGPFRELLNIIKQNYFRQVCLIVLLTLVVSVSEIISIAMLAQFLSYLEPNPLSNFTSTLGFLNFTDIFAVYGEKIFIFSLCCLLAINASLRIFLVWFLFYIGHIIGHNVGERIFNYFMSTDYLESISIKESEKISLLTTRLNHFVHHFIIPIINLFSFILLSCSIIVFSFLINFRLTIIATAIILLFYLFITRFLRDYVRGNAENINSEANNIVETLNQSFGGLKDIILNNLGNEARKTFSRSDLKYRKAIYSNQVYSIAPRFVIEAIFVILILVSAIQIPSASGPGNVSIAAIGSFAYVVQRLLPMFQGIYSSLTLIKGSQKVAKDLLYYFQSANEFVQFQTNSAHDHDICNLELKNSVAFQNVTFRYPSTKHAVFDNVSFELYKGDIVAIVGPSGEGKSTLVNILTGLLTPSSGSVLVDEIELDAALRKGWMNSLAYVPQDIFILNGDFIDNLFAKSRKVDFSIDSIKDDLQIDFAPHDHFKLSNSSLSGGQKQRVGLARSYVKDVQVVVLDEATSALDPDLEIKVLENLFKKFQNALIVIVTHSEKPLSYCNKIIEVSKKKVSIRDMNLKTNDK